MGEHACTGAPTRRQPVVARQRDEHLIADPADIHDDLRGQRFAQDALEKVITIRRKRTTRIMPEPGIRKAERRRSGDALQPARGRRNSISSALRARRLDRMKKLGTQSPMKMPKRSPWARSSCLAVNQVTIEIRIDRNPSARLTSETRYRLCLVDFVVFDFHASTCTIVFVQVNLPRPGNSSAPALTRRGWPAEIGAPAPFPSRSHEKTPAVAGLAPCPRYRRGHGLSFSSSPIGGAGSAENAVEFLPGGNPVPAFRARRGRRVDGLENDRPLQNLDRAGGAGFPRPAAVETAAAPGLRRSPGEDRAPSPTNVFLALTAVDEKTNQPHVVAGFDFKGDKAEVEPLLAGAKDAVRQQWPGGQGGSERISGPRVGNLRRRLRNRGGFHVSRPPVFDRQRPGAPQGDARPLRPSARHRPGKRSRWIRTRISRPYWPSSRPGTRRWPSSGRRLSRTACSIC